MRPTNAQILRAANLLWAWAALSEYIPDWEAAQRYRRGARRILSWFQYHFKAGIRIASGEVVLEEEPFKLFLRHKVGPFTGMMRLGLWAQEYIGKNLSIYLEDP